MDLKNLERKVKSAKESIKKQQATLKTLDKDSPRYDKCKAAIKGARTKLKNAKAEMAAERPKSKVAETAKGIWGKIPFKRTFAKIVTKTGLIVVGTVTLIGGAIIYDKMKDTTMDDGEPAAVDQV